MQLENEWLTTLSVHPGWVQTDMGNAGAKAVGMEKAAVTMEDSMAGTTREVSFAFFFAFFQNTLG